MLGVRLRKLRGSFALDVAFDAPTPGVVALIGRSGCGKSTTIDLIAGLLRPDAGRVEIDGEVLFDAGRVDVSPEKRGIGYVFQDARLFPHRSVIGNLSYGQKRSRGRPAHFGVDEILDLLGLRELLQRRAHQLSGGERQRVAIGRALLSQPRLLLLDEPLASIDRTRRREVLPYLERLRDRFRIPIVYVSHQFDEVFRLATHVVVLEQGRVLTDGDVSSVSRHPAVCAMLGPDAEGAVVEGELEAPSAGNGASWLRVGTGRIPVWTDRAVAGRVQIHVPMREVILATQEPRGLGRAGVLPGTIRAIEPDRRGARVEVESGGIVLLARVDEEQREGLSIGQHVWLIVSAVSLGDVPRGEIA